MLMPKAEETGPLAGLGGGLRSVAASGLCCEDTLRFYDSSCSYFAAEARTTSKHFQLFRRLYTHETRTHKPNKLSVPIMPPRWGMICDEKGHFAL